MDPEPSKYVKAIHHLGGCASPSQIRTYINDRMRGNVTPAHVASALWQHKSRQSIFQLENGLYATKEWIDKSSASAGGGL